MSEVLAETTGCGYHICHISTKESVQLIREAKARGVDVTCETAPHYLILDDSDLREDGKFKMNPPLRSREDRDALVAELKKQIVAQFGADPLQNGDYGRIVNRKHFDRLCGLIDPEKVVEYLGEMSGPYGVTLTAAADGLIDCKW